MFHLPKNDNLEKPLNGVLASCARESVSVLEPTFINLLSSLKVLV
jgi:hypothetical protein